jgi:hypothetical protein
MASAKSTRPSRSGNTKKKATAQQNAAERMSARGAAPGEISVPPSARRVSQERFPGERPLTGEERPIDRAGGKQQGHLQPPPDLTPSAGHQRAQDDGDRVALAARTQSSLKRKTPGRAGKSDGGAAPE